MKGRESKKKGKGRVDTIHIWNQRGGEGENKEGGGDRRKENNTIKQVDN